MKTLILVCNHKIYCLYSPTGISESNSPTAATRRDYPKHIRLVKLFAIMLLSSTAHTCQNRLETLVQESLGGAHDLSTEVNKECNSVVGNFLSAHLQTYSRIISHSLQLSLQYMSMSSNFGRDTVQRPGFKAYFRRLSDTRFERAIAMIQYATKRGASNLKQALKIKITDNHVPANTLPSIGRALSDSKFFYRHLTSLHNKALCISKWNVDDILCSPDTDLARHLLPIVESEVALINQLAAYSNQLAVMFTPTERNIAEHMFDSSLLQ